MTVEDMLKELRELATLQVRTIVGPALTPGAEPEQGKHMVISTRIKLVEGDLDTTIDPAFLGTGSLAGPLGGPLASVFEFHAAREKQANEIVRGNIETFKEIYRLVRGNPPPVVAPPPKG